jgi:hypothetical protein
MRARLVPVLALALAGCGTSQSEAPPPATPDSVTIPEPPKPREAAKPAETEKPAAPAGPSLGGYPLVFKVHTGDWTNEIVIAPWGDVVAIGGHRARLLARDSGRELLSTGICFTQSVDAAAFVDDHRMLIACDEEVQELTFPAGRVRTVFKFPERMKATAIGGGRVVAGIDGFWKKGGTTVSVYAIDGFKLVDKFDASDEVEAVAVSADGKQVAVGTSHAGIDVRDIGAKATRTLLLKDGKRHSALHFSPDGTRLFCDVASFTGGELDIATGKTRGGFETSSWLRAMRYLPGGAVVATGAAGLAIFSGSSNVESWSARDLGEGLDLSADGSYFCAAGRGGDVACFSKKPVTASTFVPEPAAPAGKGGATATPAVAVSKDGAIVSRAGKTLTVTLDDATGLAPGQQGEVSEPFQANLGFAISGYIVVARVEVKAVADRKVTLTILEETSQITLNGRKVDHFKAKQAIRLAVGK